MNVALLKIARENADMHHEPVNSKRYRIWDKYFNGKWYLTDTVEKSHRIYKSVRILMIDFYKEIGEGNYIKK